MAEPLVVGIMLTMPGREEMARKAVEAFAAQAYSNKRLAIFDQPVEKMSIGMLRNKAIEIVSDAAIIMHFDDDDISLPMRMREQVEFLASSGKECVGYTETLFWRTPQNEAWAYWSSIHPIGSSLCYWRSAWERNPFPDAPKNSQASGEDHLWLKNVSHTEKSSIVNGEPRMVCRIHGGNTMNYDEALKGASWSRVPQWDDRLRIIMEGK